MKDLAITVKRKENIYSKHNFKSLANTIEALIIKDLSNAFNTLL